MLEGSSLIPHCPQRFRRASLRDLVLGAPTRTRLNKRACSIDRPDGAAKGENVAAAISYPLFSAALAPARLRAIWAFCGLIWAARS